MKVMVIVKATKNREAGVTRGCPDPHPGEAAELEIRPIFGPSDSGAELTPELRAQWDRLRLEAEETP